MTDIPYRRTGLDIGHSRLWAPAARLIDGVLSGLRIGARQLAATPAALGRALTLAYAEPYTVKRRHRFGDSPDDY